MNYFTGATLGRAVRLVGAVAYVAVGDPHRTPHLVAPLIVDVTVSSSGTKELRFNARSKKASIATREKAAVVWRDSLFGFTPASFQVNLEHGEVTITSASQADQWIRVVAVTSSGSSVMASAPRVTMRLNAGRVELVGGGR